jgi:hypothetical protein
VADVIIGMNQGAYGPWNELIVRYDSCCGGHVCCTMVLIDLIIKYHVRYIFAVVQSMLPESVLHNSVCFEIYTHPSNVNKHVGKSWSTFVKNSTIFIVVTWT